MILYIESGIWKTGLAKMQETGKNEYKRTPVSIGIQEIICFAKWKLPRSKHHKYVGKKQVAFHKQDAQVP